MPRVAELLTRSYLSSLIQPMRVAETLGRSLPGMSRLGEQLREGKVRLPGGRPIPRTRLNAKVGPHRVWDAVMLPLDEIRAIKDVVPGATVNDVVLSIVGGGLRAWLLARDELPNDTLTAMAPISVRSEGETGAEATRSRPWWSASAPTSSIRWIAFGSFTRTRPTPRP